MDNLRDPSPRPEIVVDNATSRISDSAGASIGSPGPFGRERVVFALPLEPGPALLAPASVVRDPGPAYLADADPALVGYPAVWVSRMLAAAITEDTRRLG